MRVRDAIGWAAIVAAGLAATAAAELAVLPTPRGRRRLLYLRFARRWARIALWRRALRVDGLELIPREGPAIYAANHQSNLDIPLLHAALPPGFRWLSRDDLFAVRGVGHALRRMGAIPVVRDDRRRAAWAVRAALDALAAGDRIVVFPEGTWGAPDGRMRRFKEGIALMARRSGAPVVPLTILGSAAANPPPTLELRPAKLRVVVHAPLGAESFEGIEDDTWLARLRETIGGPLPLGAAPIA